MAQVPFSLYETQDAICKKLANDLIFKAFCTDLIGNICNVKGGEDYVSLEDSDYPKIIVNASKQSGGDDIERIVEFSVYLKVKNTTEMVDGYETYLEEKFPEMICQQIYDIVRKNFCTNTPEYFYEKDISLIHQGYIKGSFELAMEKQTYAQGDSRLW